MRRWQKGQHWLAFHLSKLPVISRVNCSACLLNVLLFSAKTQRYFVCPFVWKTAPHPSASCSLGSPVYENPTNSCPQPQCARFLQEHQGSSCMGVNEERWGRHSPGHSFQEDCTYECAVPSDCSLAVSAAHKWLQLSFFTQESAFL